jgi:hypothetical protein
MNRGAFAGLGAAVCAFAVAASPCTALAGGLAPKKASDLVTLASQSGPGCGVPSAYPLSERSLGDGTYASNFEIPAGQALIVERVRASTALAEGAELVVLVGNGTTFNVAGRKTAANNALDETDIEIEFSPGLSVRSGMSLCVAIVSKGAGTAAFYGAQAHGFLTKDK